MKRYFTQLELAKQAPSVVIALQKDISLKIGSRADKAMLRLLGKKGFPIRKARKNYSIEYDDFGGICVTVE